MLVPQRVLGHCTKQQEQKDGGTEQCDSMQAHSTPWVHNLHQSSKTGQPRLATQTMMLKVGYPVRTACGAK